jgi:hypothetical protein
MAVCIRDRSLQNPKEGVIQGLMFGAWFQVEAGPVDPDKYALYRSLTDLREPYR